MDPEHCLKHGCFISGKEVKCQPNARAGVVGGSSSGGGPPGSSSGGVLPGSGSSAPPAPSLQLLLFSEPALNAARQMPDCQAVNSCLPAAAHKADSWQQQPRNAAKDLFQQLHREPLPRGDERRGCVLAHSNQKRSKQCLWICIGFNADSDPAFFISMRMQIRIRIQGADPCGSGSNPG